MPTNICIVTGTRAEFGIWKPVLRALQKSRKLRLQLVVTGMHLQKQFGHTLDDIRAEKIPIAARVPMYKTSDTPADSLARATAGLARAFQPLRPHLVMVLGDRLEILAAANAALACQIPLAHLHGGETAPGQWDEQIRHAVTKIAHVHFPATRMAARRIAQMGEDPATIHLVGACALDSAAEFVTQNPPPRAMPCPASALVLLHPSTPHEPQEFHHTQTLLAALFKTFLPDQIHAIGPNNDPGHRGILRAYQKARLPVTMSLPQQSFWQLLSQSALLIGNSSAGILEAASFGIPVINLGDRQKGRERNPNVLDVPWSGGIPALRSAIQRARSTSFARRCAGRENLYGDGHAAERIVHILESLRFPLPTTKLFYDR